MSTSQELQYFDNSRQNTPDGAKNLTNVNKSQMFDYSNIYSGSVKNDRQGKSTEHVSANNTKSSFARLAMGKNKHFSESQSHAEVENGANQDSQPMIKIVDTEIDHGNNLQKSLANMRNEKAHQYQSTPNIAKTPLKRDGSSNERVVQYPYGEQKKLPSIYVQST